MTKKKDRGDCEGSGGGKRRQKTVARQSSSQSQ